MTTKQKYIAYCYWSYKQGLTVLSFNAWLSTVRKGKLI